MRWVKLSDVIVRANTKVDKDNTDLVYYVGGEHFESGELMVDQKGIIAGSTIGPMFYYGFKAGQFLLVSRNPHLKKAGIVEFDGICSEKTFVLQSADENVLLPEYLPFVLQNDCFWKYAVDHKHGSTNFFINWSTLANYEFPLPSIEVQKDISEVAWAAYELKKKYKNLLESTDNLVKSQFIEMFGTVPGAEYITLEQCCTAVTGGNTPSMKHEEYYGGNVPFIKSGDVKDTYVSSGALWLTEEALQKTTAKYVPAGTVIVVIRSGILKHDLPVAIASNPVVINQDLKAFQPRPEFTSQYLAWAIRSKEDELLSMTRAMTVDNIESKELYGIPVMVAPLEQQQRFAAFVEQSDKSKFELKESIKKMDGLIKSLIQNENQ